MVRLQGAGQSDPTVQRFLAACDAMLDAQLRDRRSQVAEVLNSRARELDLCTGKDKSLATKERLSDWCLRIIPHDYLESLFPSITSKKRWARFESIDSAVDGGQTGAASAAIALAIALMFSEIDDAFRTIDSAQPLKPRRKRMSTLETFFACMGDLAKMANALSLSPANVTDRVLASRSRILNRVRHTSEGRALEMFAGGQSLERACAQCDASPSLVERLLWVKSLKSHRAASRATEVGHLMLSST